jgi:hypothetical protein
MATMTDSLVTLAKYVFEKLDDAKAQLKLEDVYYGDQAKIPRTPTVCVEPGTKRRNLEGAPRVTRNTMDVMLLVYLMKIGGTTQTTRQEVDEIAESIEGFLHTDPQLNGLAIHSYVTLLESGYADRGGTLFRTARLTFEVDTKTLLPLGGV